MQKIDITLKPSLLFNSYLLLILCTSLCAIFCAGLTFWVAGWLVSLLMGYGFYLFWKFGLLRSRDSIIGISRLDNGSWLLITNDRVFPAELAGDSTLTRGLLILRFVVSGSRWKRSCVISRDILGIIQFKELFVAIKYA